MASFEEDCPVLVTRARTLAREKDFPLTREEAGARPSASLPGAGRFLAMQAAGCFGGRIGELDTGTGVGTAWMASAGHRRDRPGAGGRRPEPVRRRSQGDGADR